MRKWVMITLAGALAATAASAHSKVEVTNKAVEGRHGYYQVISASIGGLAAMAKGEVDYDAKAATAYATNLSLLAQIDPTPLYPEGTDKASLPGQTRALAKIWENPSDVQAKHEDFRTAAAALAAAAGEGLAELRGAIGPVGQTCKACHSDYRAREF